MWVPNDLGHVIEGLPSVALPTLSKLLRAAIERLIAKSSIGVAKQQKEAATQLSAAAKKQDQAAKRFGKAAKKQERVAQELIEMVTQQRRAMDEMIELVEELRRQISSERHVTGHYDPLRGALDVWSRQRAPLSLDETYHAQQLGQLVQIYRLARAYDMSHESVLERLHAAVDVSGWGDQQGSGITLQHIKRLSEEQQAFDRLVADLCDEALEGASREERQRLERIVSSIRRIRQCAKESAAEPTILVLPATGALTPEFRDAFLQSIEQVARSIEGAHHHSAEQHENTAVGGRRSPRMLVATDVLKANMVLDSNIVRRLHKVLAPFSVICVQPRYVKAALRIETWSWLRGDAEPTAFARNVNITREEGQMLDVRPEWLLAAFTTWLTVLIGSTLSALGFEGVTLLSILRPKTYSRPERLAFSTVANDVAEWLGEACGDRYGELGLAEEVNDETAGRSESLSSTVSRALISTRWKSRDFASRDGKLWMTITKQYTNDAYILALPESGKWPLRIRCWRIAVEDLDQDIAACVAAVAGRSATEVALDRIDRSFAERIKARMDTANE